METAIQDFVVRPVRLDDLEGLQQIAACLLGSMTSLPKDHEFLERKIIASLRAFDPLIDSAGSDHYLFVLEERSTGNVVGVSGILARIGGFEPFYSYRIQNETIRHTSKGISHGMPVLHLERSHKGPSEVCSLLLRPDYRQKHLGRLLSLARFVFMAEFGARFEETVIAEIRGVVGDDGHSPFWDSVARPFFQEDFHTADFWCGLGNKSYIEDLMPKYPIYISLLPQDAQDVIGEPHPRAKAAAAMLLQEGFVKTSKIDIFDAGPLLQAPRKGIRTVNECRRVKVQQVTQQAIKGDPQHLVALPSLDFRCCLATLTELGGGVSVPHHVADLLGISEGDTIIYSPLRKKGASA